MTCSICQINQRVKARGFERYMRFIGNIKVGIISSSMNVIGSSRLLYLSQNFVWNFSLPQENGLVLN